jgi:parallel beta-helix repeat protein
MRNKSWLKKGLICGIIVLMVGASVVSAFYINPITLNVRDQERDPPGDPYSVYGYVYINNIQAPAGIEVILSIVGRTNHTDITNANGQYTIDFDAVIGETAYFTIHMENQYFIPSINSSFIIAHPSPHGYYINLTLGGNWLYVGGSGPGNYSTIQAAINDTSDGDSVYVYDDSSPYYEHLAVNNSITLLGENKYTTVINGDGTKNTIWICTDRVNINGFTVCNNKTETNNAGIRISANYCTISGNILTCNKYGILLRNFTCSTCYNTIINNIIEYNYDVGLYIGESSNNTISGNNITNNYVGICVDTESTDNLIFQNTIAHHDYGGYISRDSSNNKICENILVDNNCSILLYEYCDNNEISRNTITNNNYFGIYIVYSNKNNKISMNTITNNQKSGISIEVFNDNTSVSENHIADNGLGAEVWSKNCLITKNNFINNQKQAYFLFRLFRDFPRSRWNQNYWDDWHFQCPRPIIGSLAIIITIAFALKIPWITFDRHPAKEPYDIP